MATSPWTPVDESTSPWKPVEEPKPKSDSRVGGFLHRLGQGVKGFVESASPVPTPTELQQHPWMAAASGPLMPLVRQSVSGLENIGKAGSQAKEQYQTAKVSTDPVNKPLGYARAGVTALSALDPFATPGVTNVNQLSDEGRLREASGQGAADIAMLAVPGALKPARAVMGAAGRGLKSMAGAVDPDVLGLVSPRAAHAVRLATRVGNVASKYGAPTEAPAVPGDTLAQELNQPSPAPYRLFGNKLTEPATATPRRIIGPERQLGPAPAEVPPEPQPSPLKAKTPQAAQTEIFKKMGVAAPKASLKPMESVPAATQRPAPWMTFGNKPMAGETAARMQLTHTSINALRSMALERGLKVTPGASSQALQDAIAKSLTPEEIEGFEQTASERMQPDYSVKSTGEVGVSSPKPMTEGSDLIKGLQSMKAKQGGHAGGGVSSVEELSRSGKNYIVSKSGQVSYHGKAFAPEETQPGATHVTVLPDGSFRVNAGQELTPGQKTALQNALKK